MTSDEVRSGLFKLRADRAKLTDEEVICRWMSPKTSLPGDRYGRPIPQDRQSIWWRIEGDHPIYHYPLINLTLDLLHVVEERLNDIQWMRYENLFLVMSGPLRRNMIHATAAQKIVALATVLRPEVERCTTPQSNHSPKWTPGPWKASEELSYSAFVSCGHQVPCFEVSGPQDACWIAQVLDHRNCSGTQPGPANAHLIAAAPEEDAALICCRKTLERLLEIPIVPYKSEIEAAINMARAALAKARGEK